jgi:primosomal protein N' (replication factor Y)
MPKYARVLVDDSAGKAFDYELPEAVAAVLQPGARVRVPVRTRTALATVIELLDETDVPGVKPISEVVSAEPILSPLLLKLGAWMSDYYCCSLEAAMKAVLPNVIRKAEVGHQTRLFARLAREIDEEEIEKIRKKAPLQAGVLDHLIETAQPVSVTELSEKCDASHAVVQALVKKGLIVTEAARVERDPFGDESFVHAAPLAMNPEQTAVFEHVRRAIDHPAGSAPKPLLLHGVTGSGKTEIYLQAIHLVLERGQTAIMLVPEISLTPQTVERFKSRFAATQHEVAVLRGSKA